MKPTNLNFIVLLATIAAALVFGCFSCTSDYDRISSSNEELNEQVTTIIINDKR